MNGATAAVASFWVGNIWRFSVPDTGSKNVKKILAIAVLVAAHCAASAQQPQRNLGNLSANPFNPNSTSNPYGAGNPYDPNSVKNPYGQHGSRYSNDSANNPYATNAPKLYDSQGNYRGKLSANPYDPDSTSNPNGRYGSKYSPDSINNPFGAGNPYSADSPNNPYGKGMQIRSGDDN